MQGNNHRTVLAKWALRVLSWFCPKRFYETIEGDLLEQYEIDRKEAGDHVARKRLVVNTLNFVRPGILVRNKFSLQPVEFLMLQNYFKITYRQWMKTKVFSFVNATGLAVGIAASILIAQYVIFELSYDRFHPNSDRIYRVCHNRYQDGTLQYEKAQSFIPTGEALKNDHPEVLDYTTLFKISEQAEIVISYIKNSEESIKFSEENVYHVRGNFFSVFPIHIAEGPPNIKSIEPATVLISAAVARKYFDNESPLNKIIHHTYNGDFRVVGVFDNLPENSHLKIDFLFAWKPITEDAQGGDLNNWHWDGFYTYVLLAEGIDAKVLDAKLAAFAAKYLGEAEDRIGDSKFYLQPIRDIHLHSHLLGEAEPNGNNTIVEILRALAVFILIMAYINYINLSSAKATDRAKEIGIRKIVGSERRQLIGQHLLESLMMNTVAAILSLVIVWNIVAFYGDALGFPKSFSLLDKQEFWVVFGVLIAVGSFVAGLYPAIVISSFKPVHVLKGRLVADKNDFTVRLRRGMVTFQFALSIIMITVSTIIYKQLRFMKDRELGINIDQTLVLRTFVKFGPPGSDSLFMKKLETFKSQLQLNPRIEGAAASYDIPGKEHLSLFSNFRHFGNNQQSVSIYSSRIDADFIPLFDARIIAGRNFSRDLPSDQQAIIINMEALETLGFDTAPEAIDQEVSFGRGANLGKVKVIGVVDFRSRSFKEHNYPIAYQTHWAPFRFLSIKFLPTDRNDLRASIGSIKLQWEKLYTDEPFDYFFLDDFFNKQYEAEQQFSASILLITGLALFIAFLGLYGLATLITSQRIKEIGLRRLLGASVTNLLLMVSCDFGLLILVAGILSLPPAYYYMSHWLDNYAYRTQISWWVFVAPILVLIFVVFITVGHHVIRAASINPVRNLRNE